MNEAIKKQEVVELLTPEEYMKRLGIKKSALHLWKAKGWLLPGRHFIKIGRVVRYWWSEDRLMEIHENSMKESEQHKHDAIKLEFRSPSRDRVNWDL